MYGIKKRKAREDNLSSLFVYLALMFLPYSNDLAAS